MKLGKTASLALLMGSIMSGGRDPFSEFENRISKRLNDNPHNFHRFETNGFVTYSVNQQAHDNKYAKYCKKKGI